MVNVFSVQEAAVYCSSRDLTLSKSAYKGIFSARKDLCGRQGSVRVICNVETVDQLTNYTSLLSLSLSPSLSDSFLLPPPLSLSLSPSLSLAVSLPIPRVHIGKIDTQRHAHST